MSEPDSTVIAGTRSQPKTCGDWRIYRSQLVPGSDKALWEAAFQEYFRPRIRLRYLEPIELLQQVDAKQGEGFAIVAIHCSLIEFLESTFQGKSYRYLKKGSPPLDPSREYNLSGDVFRSFLCNRQPFAQVFKDPLLASDFYENVRCALLHEARTKNGWKIRAKDESGSFLDEKTRMVFHNGFQAALNQTIDWYKNALFSDATLQEGFVRKFDSLCA